MRHILEIKVRPSSGRQLIKRDKTGKITCSLKSAPEKGKANQELVTFLSRALSIPQENVVITRGTTSRNKTVQISSEQSRDDILQLLGLEIQASIIE